ncbi:MAG TPA: hypothetical protein VFB08_00515 [Burkholderiales bacterium]|nr:hypothetical protein [Burkholderiales bacterium]
MKRPDRKLALAAAALMVAAAAAAAAVGPQGAPERAAGGLEAFDNGDAVMPYLVQKRLVSWGDR